MELIKFYSNYEDNNVVIIKTKFYKLIAIISYETQTLYLSDDVDTANQLKIMSAYYLLDVTILPYKDLAKYHMRLLRD